jgi:hypothetical protein
MVVSGQIYTMAILPRGKEFTVSIGYKDRWAYRLGWIKRKREKSDCRPPQILRRPAHSPVRSKSGLFSRPKIPDWLRCPEASCVIIIALESGGGGGGVLNTGGMTLLSNAEGKNAQSCTSILPTCHTDGRSQPFWVPD